MSKFYNLAHGRSASVLRAIFFSILTVIGIADLQSQVATGYAFTSSSGAYVPITGGTSLGSTSTDDQRFVDPAVPLGGTTNTGVGFPIGFSFTYNAVAFDRVAICANGWISLGQSALTPSCNINSTSFYVPFASTSAIAPAQLRSRIAAEARDLQAQAGATLRIETVGTAPNRTCVIQWLGYKRFSTSGTGDILNFQIRLNEGGGISSNQTVQVVYDTNTFGASATSTSVAQSGLGGNASTDFNGRKTVSPHDWNIHSAIAGNTEGLQFPYTGVPVVGPAAGLTFTWTPITVCATPPVGGTVAGPLALTLGQIGTYTVTGNAAAIQWQSSIDNITFTDIAGATIASQGLFIGTAGTYYLRNRANGAFCTDSFSNVLTIVVSNTGNLPCSPTPLALGTNGPFNTAAYTADAGEVAPPGGGCSLAGNWCNTTLSNTGWFSFVAPASGRITIQSPSFDTQLALWSTTNCASYVGTFTLLAANDDDASYTTHAGVQFSSYLAIDCPSLTPGATYLIQLDAYSSPGGGTTIILTDPGVVNATYTGLPATACTLSSTSTLVPTAGTGVFSGPGVTGTTFNPATAGPGTHTITYTREAPYTCFASSQQVVVSPAGCNDPTACNFNPLAGCNDGTCNYLFGCTDPTACNFDPTAICDNGLCNYLFGCTNGTACNFDPTAICDDGSCILPDGCTDPAAANYSPVALCDDGSCVYGGNENPIDAIAVNLVEYGLGACNSVVVDLSTAFPSAFAHSSAITGEDLWYKFVATTSASRIRIDSFFDIFVELQDAGGNMLDVEHHNGAGVEILNAGGLTVGDTYFVGVRNYNSAGGNGTATLCIHAIQATGCDYGPGPYTLCQSFKADYVGAAQYIFHFTSQTTLNTYSKNNGSNTSIVLSTVPGLTWGDTYDVSIDAVFNLLDGTNAVEPITVESNSPCYIVVSAQPSSVLRPSDNCANHSPHLIGNSIATSQFICAATDWHWTFTRTDIAELPIDYYKGSSSRFVKLSDVGGLTPGGTYSVSVAPIFSYGPGVAGPSACIALAGPAGMALDGNGNDQGHFATNDKMDTDMIESALYPNPIAGDLVYLNITGLEASQLILVNVYDVDGKVVYTGSMSGAQASSAVLTFGSPLADGIYTVHVTGGGVVLATERLVVQR